MQNTIKELLSSILNETPHDKVIIEVGIAYEGFTGSRRGRIFKITEEGLILSWYSSIQENIPVDPSPLQNGLMGIPWNIIKEINRLK